MPGLRLLARPPLWCAVKATALLPFCVRVLVCERTQPRTGAEQRPPPRVGIARAAADHLWSGTKAFQSLHSRQAGLLIVHPLPRQLQVNPRRRRPGRVLTRRRTESIRPPLVLTARGQPRLLRRLEVALKERPLLVIDKSCLKGPPSPLKLRDPPAKSGKAPALPGEGLLAWRSPADLQLLL